jgi:hypothetical protein
LELSSLLNRRYFKGLCKSAPVESTWRKVDGQVRHAFAEARAVGPHKVQRYAKIRLFFCALWALGDGKLVSFIRRGTHRTTWLHGFRSGQSSFQMGIYGSEVPLKRLG